MMLPLSVAFPVTVKLPLIVTSVELTTMTFDVPPTDVTTLPPELTTRTFDVPFCIDVASIPVS